MTVEALEISNTKIQALDDGEVHPNENQYYFDKRVNYIRITLEIINGKY